MRHACAEVNIIVIKGQVLALVALDSFVVACQQSQLAALEGYLLDVGVFDAVIMRRSHLIFRRQVQPQLYAQHPLGGRQLLLMQDAGAGRHPLHFAVADGILIAQAVLVRHKAAVDITDRLDAAVRVQGKAGGVVIGVDTVKGVEHQKRIIGLDRFVSQYAHQADPRAVLCPEASDGLNDCSFHLLISSCIA